MRRFAEEEQNDEKKEEKTPKGMMDKLLETRTITIFGEINMKLAQEIAQKLLILSADSDEEI